MHINTKSELKSWLDANFWLEDLVLETIEPLPVAIPQEGNALPKNVKLVGKLHVGGSYKAGEICWVRDIVITAKGVKSYSISSEGFLKEYCCDGIDLVEADELGILLDVPGNLKIVCTSFDVSQHSDKQEKVKRWLSTTEFCVHATRSTLPTPADWVSHLNQRGWDAVWRYYCSDEQTLKQVPLDYTGWFLQLRSRLFHNSQGLFFSSCKIENGQLSMSLHNYDSVLRGLWVDAGKYIATFPDVIVLCGNATMDKSEWLSYLESLGD